MKTQSQNKAADRVTTRKSLFLVAACDAYANQNPSLQNGRLAQALNAIREPHKANGGASVAAYFSDTDRFSSPMTIGAEIEGALLNGLLVLSHETREMMTKEQDDLFGAITAPEVASFIAAVQTTTVRTEDGEYDVQTYIGGHRDTGSKDSQLLAAAFSMDKPVQNARQLEKLVSATWREGGIQNRDAKNVRKAFGIAVSPEVIAAAGERFAELQQLSSRGHEI